MPGSPVSASPVCTAEHSASIPVSEEMNAKTNIEIQYLRVGQSLPEQLVYVLVEKIVSGGYVVTQATASRIASRQGPFARVTDALESAKLRANNIGIDIVHVRKM